MIEAHNIVKMDNLMITEAVKKDFGFEIKNAEKVTKGYSSQVYEAEIDDNKIYIRINQDPKVFESEILGYEIFKKQGIPVPDILAYKEKPESIGEPTMIMSSAKGSLIDKDMSTEERAAIFKNVGKLLHKINETKIEGFGKVIPKDGKLVGVFPNWEEYWIDRKEHNYKALNFLIDNKIINEIEIERVKKTYEELEVLNLNESSLLHLDVHQGHFFTDNSEITGIIDLGRLSAGDPRYDIAMSLIYQDPIDQVNFKEGYGALANDPMVEKYYIAIAVRKIYFLSKVGKQNHDDFIGLVQKLKEKLGNI